MTIDPKILELADNYKSATLEFYNFVKGISADVLDKKKSGASAEDWSPRQVIHHMMDSESTSFLRLRRLIAEPGSIIQGYDEMAWANNPFLGYKQLGIENSLAVYISVREASYQQLLRINPEHLKNSCNHSESGPFTLEKWLSAYSKHPLDHLGQIKEALA